MNSEKSRIITGKEAQITLDKLLDRTTGQTGYPEPFTAGYFKADALFIAFDNTTGNCWVESFKNEDQALLWCKGELEAPDFDGN